MNVRFVDLEAAEHRVRNAVAVSAKAANGAVYPLDLLTWAVGDRTASLVRAFRLLVESRNLFVAGATLRMQLDTYLRFMAAWHVDDPHAFAKAVISGTRVDKLRDRTGTRLLDRHLVEIASQDEPWIKRVYDTTSGYVHFSQDHVLGVARESKHAPTAISLALSGEDPPNATDDSRQEAIDCMEHTVALVERQILGWAATKERTFRDQHGT